MMVRHFLKLSSDNCVLHANWDPNQSALSLKAIGPNLLRRLDSDIGFSARTHVSDVLLKQGQVATSKHAGAKTLNIYEDWEAAAAACKVCVQVVSKQDLIATVIALDFDKRKMDLKVAL